MLVEERMEGWSLSKRQVSVSSGSGGQIRGCVAEEMCGGWNRQLYKTSRNIKALGKIWLRTDYNSSLVCKGLQCCWIVTNELCVCEHRIENWTCIEYGTRTWVLFWDWLLGHLFAWCKWKGWVDCKWHQASYEVTVASHRHVIGIKWKKEKPKA